MSTLVVIGGGPAGYVAAIKASSLGKKVILIEEKDLGGTCLNEGCMPTKSLLESALTYEKVKKAGRFGIEVPNEAAVNWSGVQAYKHSVVHQLVQGIKYLMKKNKINVINGRASFINHNRVRVQKEDSVDEIEGTEFIIATGSVPVPLPFAPFDGDWIIHSGQAMSLSTLPSSLIIVGGGVIGCEFASIYSRLGTKVTIIEGSPNLLPHEDEDISALLHEKLAEDGVEIYTNARLESVEKKSKKVNFITSEGRCEESQGNYVLVSVGRKPKTSDLGLGRAGVKFTDEGVTVNEHMQTSVPNIYACGDIIGGIQLAHVAFHEGAVAALHACGEKAKVNYRAVPRCVYTFPEVASVGFTEREAREVYDRVKIGEFSFGGNGKALITGEPFGKVKVMIEEEFNEIIGLSIVGPKATELIGQGTVMIHSELTIDIMEDFIAAHPTLSEAIHEALLNTTGSAVHA
ncbi:dihydrolipoyl dehydrogenase [Priestia endophytica]|uniref:Dihydrolipoyl dehydrogenase n=1 Tax=Priestia endophytica TaxID=135735 RepID=A0AAX1Q456_9BACI|nr:dihydrolipoyl dehydrogenase [Priestia endophytica]RAS73454.1 dihydrolipoyl dehydrogenase [Priestia endophytica]